MIYSFGDKKQALKKLTDEMHQNKITGLHVVNNRLYPGFILTDSDDNIWCYG